jgi:hypothetical protein
MCYISIEYELKTDKNEVKRFTEKEKTIPKPPIQF